MQMVQVQQGAQDMASQCGPAGSAAEMGETEEMRELHTKLDIVKGGYDDLQCELEQVLEECKHLQRLLEHERGGAAAEELHTMFQRTRQQLFSRGYLCGVQRRK